MVDNLNKLIGCFVSATTLAGERNNPHFIDYGAQFRVYLWDKDGFDSLISTLNRGDYGNEIQFILVKYYVNPSDFELPYIKAVSGYSKKEQSVALSIVINSTNFFSRTEAEKRTF